MYECLPDSFYDINIKSGQSAIFLLTNMKFDVDVEKDYEKLVIQFFKNLSCKKTALVG